jgi:hypothetical protein
MRPDIPPRTSIDFATKKAAAIGAFLENDFGTIDEIGTVDEQRTTLAAQNILGLVKTERPNIANAAERTSLVNAAQIQRSILDNGNAMTSGNRGYCVEVAGNPCIMNSNVRARVRVVIAASITPRRYSVCQAGHRRTPAPRRVAQSIGRRHERMRRHHYFVARGYVRQQRGHLQRCRKRMR